MQLHPIATFYRLLTGRMHVWVEGVGHERGPQGLLYRCPCGGAPSQMVFGASWDVSATAYSCSLVSTCLCRWNLFTSSLFFTIPIFFVSMVLPMIPGTEPITSTLIFGFPCNQLVKWILATPVQFVVGWRFHKGAVKALRRGTANMDVLVSLGTNASYIYSVISVMHHHLNR